MRRSSDSRPGGRTGRGRRARDRLLSGEPPGRAAAGSAGATEADNLLYFVGDDLREAALAVGGLEQFLVAVEGLLAGDQPGEAPGRAIDRLLADVDLEGRLGELDAALGSLVRSLVRLRGALDEAGYEAMPTAKIA